MASLNVELGGQNESSSSGDVVDNVSDDDSDVICIVSPHHKKNLSNSNVGGLDDSDDCVILEDDLLDAENINDQSDKHTAKMECKSFAEFKGAGDELVTSTPKHLSESADLDSTDDNLEIINEINS